MTFQLIDFINIEHQFASLIKFIIKNKLAEVTFDQFKFYTFIDFDRIRATSEASDLFRFWSFEWATDKSLFKRAVRKFENNFSDNNNVDLANNSIIKKSRHISNCENMFEQNSFSANRTVSDSDFFSAQLTNLSRLISQVMNNRDNAAFLLIQSINEILILNQRQTKNWSAKNIEFFDSTADDTHFIINIDKHVCYRDVYVFTNRLKDMTIIKNDSKLRIVISQCLRESTLTWHSIEFSTLKKEMLRKTSFVNWYNALIRRFKERTSVALINMQTIKYIMKNARLHKNSRIFAQNLFRSVKTANLISTHN